MSEHVDKSELTKLHSFSNIFSLDISYWTISMTANIYQHYDSIFDALMFL